MKAGDLRHRVTLENPTTVKDGAGGYTDTWTAFATRLPALVAPATVQTLERLVASSVQAHGSHLVTIRYRASVTTKTRVIYHDVVDRTLAVTGVSETDASHIGLVLVCDEVVT